MEGQQVFAEAWGPGAHWLLHHLPTLIGADDDPSALIAQEPLVERMQRRAGWLRMGRTHAVFEAALPTVIEQKVTGLEAKRSYFALVKMAGEPAPGPFGLMLPPHPAAIAAMPYHSMHPLGLEKRRADIVRHIATNAGRLEETSKMPLDAAYRRLLAIPGIGQWTAAEVASSALGDVDAVSVGDYHLKNIVCYAFTGEPRGTDERMLELLEPYRGQRGRVVRMIKLTCKMPPRFGPRMPIRSFARD
ncbi:MAG: DNA-3-methyladenine glycosylase [Actinomycetota bacterium]